MRHVLLPQNLAGLPCFLFSRTLGLLALKLCLLALKLGLLALKLGLLAPKPRLLALKPCLLAVKLGLLGAKLDFFVSMPACIMSFAKTRFAGCVLACFADCKGHVNPRSTVLRQKMF